MVPLVELVAICWWFWPLYGIYMHATPDTNMYFYLSRVKYTCYSFSRPLYLFQIDVATCHIRHVSDTRRWTDVH